MSTQEPSINMTLEEYFHLLQEMENIKQERDELKQSLEQTVNEKSRLSSEIEANQAIITQLRWRIADLSRRLWGKSSEKRSLPENPVHLNVCFDSPSDVEDPVVEEKKAVAKATTTENVYNRFRKNFTKKITPHARKPIDASLPREEIFIPMPEGVSLEGAVKLGEEVNNMPSVPQSFMSSVSSALNTGLLTEVSSQPPCRCWHIPEAMPPQVFWHISPRQSIMTICLYTGNWIFLKGKAYI
jgi:transposase